MVVVPTQTQVRLEFARTWTDHGANAVTLLGLVALVRGPARRLRSARPGRPQG
jgi:hypothetical protein